MLRHAVVGATAAIALMAAIATAQPAPVLVGVLETLSGQLQMVGKDFQAGVQLYVKTKPTVLGRPIRLVEEDTQSVVPRAIEGLRKLVEADKVVAVVGGLNSAAAVSVAPEAQKRKALYVEALARADNVTASDTTFVFRVSNSAARDARHAARFLASKPVKTVSTVAADDAVSRGLVDALVTELKKTKGVSVVTQRTVAYGKDVTDDVTAVRTASDLLVLALPPALFEPFAKLGQGMGVFREGRLTVAFGGVGAWAPPGIIVSDDDDPGWDDG